MLVKRVLIFLSLIGVTFILSGCAQDLIGIPTAKGSATTTLQAEIVPLSKGKGQAEAQEVRAQQAEIGLNQTVSGFLNPEEYDIYVIRGVASGARVSVTLSGPSNADFDLYVWECSQWHTSLSYTSNESTSFTTACATDIWIFPYAYSGSGNYSLSVSGEVPRPQVRSISLGGAASGSLAGDGDSVLYQFDLSILPGTRVIAVLNGPAGADFDLYMSQGSPPQVSGWECSNCVASGVTGSANEVVSAPVGGTVYLLVKSWRGSGAFTLGTAFVTTSGPSTGFFDRAVSSYRRIATLSIAELAVSIGDIILQVHGYVNLASNVAICVGGLLLGGTGFFACAAPFVLQHVIASLLEQALINQVRALIRESGLSEATLVDVCVSENPLTSIMNGQWIAVIEPVSTGGCGRQ